MKRLIILMRWASVLTIVFTLLSLLSSYYSSDVFQAWAVLGVFFPFLYLLNLFFVLFFVLTKKRYALLSLFCLILGWSVFSRTVNLFSFEKTDNGNIASVVNLNVGLQSSKTLKSRLERLKEDRISFERWIQTQRASILLLQEVQLNREGMRKLFSEYEYYKFSKPRKVAVLSRYPILREGEVDDGKIGMWVDLQLSNKQVYRVFNVHLESSNFNRKALYAATSAKVSKRSTWNGILAVAKRYYFASQSRIKQVNILLKEIEESPYPVILGGDLNETPNSYVYRQINNALSDGFDKGVGLGATYVGRIPLLKIDYLFHSSGVSVLSQKRVANDFSDHYGLLTKISLE